MNEQDDLPEIEKKSAFIFLSRFAPKSRIRIWGEILAFVGWDSFKPRTGAGSSIAKKGQT